MTAVLKALRTEKPDPRYPPPDILLDYVFERTMWKELGLNREALGLPPLSSKEVDLRYQIAGLIQAHTLQQQAHNAAPKSPGPRRRR